MISSDEIFNRLANECYAKHWALSLLDRVKRLKKGKADE